MLDHEFTHSTSLSPMNHHSARWNRRDFLHRSLSVGVATALTGMVTPPILAEPKKRPTLKASTGISELHLQTHKIAALETFYGQSLGLPTQRNNDELTIDAGATRILPSDIKIQAIDLDGWKRKVHPPR